MGADQWNYFSLNCMAHTLNLLAKDLASEFQGQFDQAHSVVTFMGRGQPRLEWEKSRKMHDGNELVKPCDTRWGSMIDVVESITNNRVALLQTCFKLRSLEYKFKHNELWWIYSDPRWKIFKGALNGGGLHKSTLESTQKSWPVVGPTSGCPGLDSR